MRFYHRTSLFPLVIILLTGVLAGFIFWSTKNESAPVASVAQQEVEPVDANAYRSELSRILMAFKEQLVSSQDDLDKLLAVQKALAGVLALRVPSEFRDLHLALAVALSQMENALESGERNIDEPLAQIEDQKRLYPWLVQ